jgi:hypothetical protein
MMQPRIRDPCIMQIQLRQTCQPAQVPQPFRPTHFESDRAGPLDLSDRRCLPIERNADSQSNPNEDQHGKRDADRCRPRQAECDAAGFGCGIGYAVSLPLPAVRMNATHTITAGLGLFDFSDLGKSRGSIGRALSRPWIVATIQPADDAPDENCGINYAEHAKQPFRHTRASQQYCRRDKNASPEKRYADLRGQCEKRRYFAVAHSPIIPRRAGGGERKEAWHLAASHRSTDTGSMGPPGKQI